MCLAASLLFALGFGFMGGILAQTASIIDGVDGEVARLKYQETALARILTPSLTVIAMPF